jgi:hypothetical protein
MVKKEDDCAVRLRRTEPRRVQETTNIKPDACKNIIYIYFINTRKSSKIQQVVHQDVHNRINYRFSFIFSM